MGRNNKKNLAAKAIPEKQCDEYTRYRRSLFIDVVLKRYAVSGLGSQQSAENLCSLV